MISNLGKYILVEPPEGINFLEIMKGIVELFTMSAYHEKNDIWVFKMGHVDLLYSDIHEIKKFVDEHYPKTATARKTAIVVDANLQQKLATEYRQIGTNLPREIKIFSDIKTARAWITKDTI
jgi:hypothetical protein